MKHVNISRNLLNENYTACLVVYIYQLHQQAVTAISREQWYSAWNNYNRKRLDQRTQVAAMCLHHFVESSSCNLNKFGIWQPSEDYHVRFFLSYVSVSASIYYYDPWVVCIWFHTGSFIFIYNHKSFTLMSLYVWYNIYYCYAHRNILCQLY